jgi:hypothetical protein
MAASPLRQAVQATNQNRLKVLAWIDTVVLYLSQDNRVLANVELLGGFFLLFCFAVEISNAKLLIAEFKNHCSLPFSWDIGLYSPPVELKFMQNGL